MNRKTRLVAVRSAALWSRSDDGIARSQALRLKNKYARIIIALFPTTFNDACCCTTEPALPIIMDGKDIKDVQ
jgi:hypothetical protein